MKNLEIAKILYNIADILELQEVQWKPQAYRRAAQAIESLTEDIYEVYQKEELEEIPGIGKNIAAKISEYLETGKIKKYERLKKLVKVNLEELHAVPGLGPKRIKILYQKLGIKNIQDLEKAAREQKIRNLAGFKEETEKNILEGISLIKSRPRRFLYAQARPIVEEIRTILQKSPFVEKLEIAGSFRRGKETIGDLDFLAISKQPEKVMDAFTRLPDIREIIAKGKTKSSILLRNGIQVDLRVVKEKEFGSAMNYFIGNKEHNVELRKFSLSKGYTLSEYGLFTAKDKKWVAGRTEEEVYKKLGLQYIPPELRENNGELAAAQKHKLPSLIVKKDLQGVFHNHSTWTDGSNSLLEMAQKAEQLGLKFISFNDHFGHIGITNPLTEKRLSGYIQEIEKVQKKVGITVLSGIEIDILKDGTLPLSKKKLQELDVVIASVHSAFKMTGKEMTTRVCSVLENYPVNILGHPTDRILNVREPLKINLDRVFETAATRNVFLEINCSPQRMDLDGRQIKAALEAGCRCAISTDAHSLRGLEMYPLGIMLARRGWAEKKDIVNCWSMTKIKRSLEKLKK